jgi:predicted dehydrogenase
LYCGWTRLDSWPNAIDARLEVGGNRGVVAVRAHDDGGLIVTEKERRFVDAMEAPRVQGILGGVLYTTVRHFYHCLSSSGEFAIALEEAISAVAVAEAINRSVESGRVETVQLVSVS